MHRRGLMRCYKEQDMPVTSPIRVPFLWENSPGVSKVSGKTVKAQPKLPPPPSCCVAKRVTPLRAVDDHETQVTNPTTCSFHGKLKSPFHYAAAVRDRGKPGDPFLAAYIKCTAASPLLVPRKTKSAAGKGIKARFRSYLLKLSCKSTHARGDTLLPTPHFHQEKRRN